MNLRDLQEDMKSWLDHNFEPYESWQPLLGVVEELGELAHAHLKQSQNIRIEENHEEKIKDAIGDIIIFLVSYCNKRGFDLDKIVFDTWSKVKNRDWKEYPVNGVDK